MRQMFAVLLMLMPLGTTAGAQEFRTSASGVTTDQVSGPRASFLNRLGIFVKGRTSPDGLWVAPFGWHITDPLNASNISSNNLIALQRKSLSGGTFINSFGDRVWFLGATRNLYSRERFGLDYTAGLMVGYDGKLAGTFSGPLKPLFEGNVSPFLAISPYYKLSRKLDLRLLFAPPKVVLIGLKYYF